jgi:colanic acid biosynthesis glycosyl transferase WcaI
LAIETPEKIELEPGGAPKKHPAVLVLYHYLYPDDVVSSIHFSELCFGLASRGWRVVGSSSCRGCRDEQKKYPLFSEENGVQFRRIWRPKFRQSSGFGRLANAVWMIAAWSFLALDPRIRPDAVIVGTDPILSPLVALAWRALRPGVRMAHWCFDLYPEAAIAAGLLAENSIVTLGLKRLLRWAYGRCALIVDIGMCMRRRLDLYGSKARKETIAPWALVEPDGPSSMDPTERQLLFGESAIGLLYSGTFGLAHTWDGVPELARILARSGGKVVFSVQGNAVAELRNGLQQAGAPVCFVPFAPSHLLGTRLSAADVHIVSLKEAWTGTVVPSKFFGALAMGRPVLFLGSRESAVARWIEEFQVGWVVTPANVPVIADDIVSSLRPESKEILFKHCHRVYRDHFSREQALDRWSEILGALESITF